MNSDLETLLAATAYRAQAGVAGEPVDAALERLPGPDSSQTAADLAAQVKSLIESAVAGGNNSPSATPAAPPSGPADSPSVGEDLARTAATLTGVGPLVTGLLKLFGSAGDEPLPALQKYIAPGSISVEAALTRDRGYSGLRYSQGGGAESLPTGSSGAGQGPTIQVNIQAMDSQSFLDRQDDIARAVREAMLHSNSINDVVLEL
jgi:hypothetical protein